MQRIRGGALAKYLLLIVACGLLIAFWWWKDNYGVIGGVKPLPEATHDQIAFVRQDANGQTNIYTIKADGSDERALTSGKGGKRTPAWSPDGKQLCYAGEPDETGAAGRTYQLFLLGSGRPVQATYGSIAKDQPQWRPDGKQIAFLTGGAIKVIDPNGDNLRQVYPVPHRESAGEHAEGEQETSGLKSPPLRYFRWSPNSSSLAAIQVMEGENAPTLGRGQWWQKSENGSSEPTPEQRTVVEPESVIVLPGIDGSEPFIPHGAMAHVVGIDWLPDGKRLAVTLSTSERRHGLLVYRADEKMVTPRGIFAARGYTAALENPAVSPDGKQVAAEVWRMDSAENRELLGITVLPLDSDSPLVINRPEDIAKIPLKIKGHAKQPQWSPDGTRLLYTLPGPSGRDLWVANADGSNPLNLTKGKGDNFDAVWSPARR